MTWLILAPFGVAALVLNLLMLVAALVRLAAGEIVQGDVGVRLISKPSTD